MKTVFKGSLAAILLILVCAVLAQGTSPMLLNKDTFQSHESVEVLVQDGYDVQHTLKVMKGGDVVDTKTFIGGDTKIAWDTGRYAPGEYKVILGYTLGPSVVSVENKFTITPTELVEITIERVDANPGRSIPILGKIENTGNVKVEGNLKLALESAGKTVSSANKGVTLEIGQSTRLDEIFAGTELNAPNQAAESYVLRVEFSSPKSTKSAAAEVKVTFLENLNVSDFIIPVGINTGGLVQIETEIANTGNINEELGITLQVMSGDKTVYKDQKKQALNVGESFLYRNTIPTTEMLIGEYELSFKIEGFAKTLYEKTQKLNIMGPVRIDAKINKYEEVVSGDKFLVAVENNGNTKRNFALEIVGIPMVNPQKVEFELEPKAGRSFDYNVEGNVTGYNLGELVLSSDGAPLDRKVIMVTNAVTTESANIIKVLSNVDAELVSNARHVISSGKPKIFVTNMATEPQVVKKMNKAKITMKLSSIEDEPYTVIVKAMPLDGVNYYENRKVVAMEANSEKSIDMEFRVMTTQDGGPRLAFVVYYLDGNNERELFVASKEIKVYEEPNITGLALLSDDGGLLLQVIAISAITLGGIFVMYKRNKREEREVKWSLNR